VSNEIYKYLDYRSYLRDRIEALRKEEKYSARKFAASVGFKSPTTLGQIISGRRNVSKDALKKIAKGLQLGPKEAQFLAHLVDFTQAKTMEEKNSSYQEILKFHNFRKTHHLAQAQYELFSNSYMVFLLEALNGEFSKKSVAAMAAALQVSANDIKEALQRLEDLGLIIKEGIGWRRVNDAMETSDETHSINIRNFHKEMLRASGEAIDRINSDKRTLGALCISLKEKNFVEIRDKFNQFMADLAASYGGDKSPDAVYQINFQIFPAVELK